MMPFVSWSGAPTNSPICPTFHLSSDHNSFPVCHDVPSVHTVPQKRLYIIRQIILLFCVTNWISHEFTSPSISSSSSFHQQISAEREGGASHMRIVESIISTPVLSTKHLDLQDCCTMKRKLHFLAPVVLILYPSATVSAFRPKFGRNTSFSWANRSVKLFGKPKDDLPANLKRKVDAKRPQLGHIVPNDTRAKGGRFFRSNQILLCSILESSLTSHETMKLVARRIQSFDHRGRPGPPGLIIPAC